jgi:capsular polysaccharide export protein
MGFEALLLGKECVCFGMPFYAGWGLTDDRIKCSRRKRKLTVNQLFAGAYILYCRYYNPYLNQESDIIDTLYTIKKYRDIETATSSACPVPGFSAAFEQVRKFFEQTVSSSRKIMARIK